jgi:hypothetical protein
MRRPINVRVGAEPQPHLINTPLQRGDIKPNADRNRFNGFTAVQETVETVQDLSTLQFTPLKRGVNETSEACEFGHYQAAELEL